MYVYYNKDIFVAICLSFLFWPITRDITCQAVGLNTWCTIYYKPSPLCIQFKPSAVRLSKPRYLFIMATLYYGNLPDIHGNDF